MLKSDKYVKPDSWQIFDNWNNSQQLQSSNLNWDSFDKLIPYYNSIIESHYDELIPLLGEWNILLKELGNDPSNYNWENFRPLRLRREEDWSDWLAHLLETSATGTFAKYLFQIPNFDYQNYSNPKKITREEIEKNYRADIIIQWNNSFFTHLEVKIGDMNLIKTYDTSELFQNKYNASHEIWTNYILLLSYQMIEWENTIENTDSNKTVISLTWEDVCIALRKALLSDEAITWKVWAYSFLGAIEQLLIGFRGYLINSKIKPKDNLDKKIYILQNSLIYE